MERIRHIKPYKLLMAIVSVFLFIFYIRKIDQINMIFVLPDEYGYWMTAATFAGYDWSGLAGLSLYYSYGYSIFLAPLFLIFKDPVMMYKAALCMNALFYVAAFLISCVCGFRLVKDIGGMMSADTAAISGKALQESEAGDVRRTQRMRVKVVLICAVIALYCNNVVQVNIAWSEALLYFVYWLSFYTLLRYCEKRSTVTLVLFVIEVTYMYIIHQRMLGVVIAAVLAVLIAFGIKYAFRSRHDGTQSTMTDRKTSKKNVLIALVCIILIVAAFFVLKRYLTGYLWSSQSEDRLAANNFSGQLAKLAAIFSADGIINLLCHVCGKLFYFFLATGSVVFWAGICAGHRIIDGIRQTRRTAAENEPKVGSSYLLLYMYLLLSFLGMLGITCIFLHGVGGRIDNVVYGRYIEPVIGACMLVGAIYMMEKKPRWYTLAVYLVLFVVMGMAADSIMVQDTKFVRFMSTGSNIFYVDKPEDVFLTYAAIATGLIMAVLAYMASRYKKTIIWCMFFAMMMCYWGGCVHRALDRGMLTTHKYINQIIKLDGFIDAIEDRAGYEDIPIYYTINEKEEDYDYIYRIFHLQFLRKSDTIRLIDKNELTELDGQGEDYFLIQYHTDGLDMDKYSVVAQWYGLVLMVPNGTQLEQVCRGYTDTEYYEIEGTMSGGATMTVPGSYVFDSDYETGFVIFAQDMCLTPGRYLVEADVRVEFDEDKEAWLQAEKGSVQEFPRTVGYADASYDYGAGLFCSQPVVVESMEQLEADDNLIHVTYELDCSEAKGGVEIRFYAEGCARITIEGLRYKTISESSPE